MSSLNFLELFLVSNCANKVNNFTNLFCEVNVPLPFWPLNSSFLSLLIYSLLFFNSSFNFCISFSYVSFDVFNLFLYSSSDIFSLFNLFSSSCIICLYSLFNVFNLLIDIPLLFNSFDISFTFWLCS